MSQITFNIVNNGSIKLQVTVRDLLAGAVPPVLPPTWIEPGSPPKPLLVEAEDNGCGRVRWSAQNEAGVETGAAIVDVDPKTVIDVGR